MKASGTSEEVLYLISFDVAEGAKPMLNSDKRDHANSHHRNKRHFLYKVEVIINVVHIVKIIIYSFLYTGVTTHARGCIFWQQSWSATEENSSKENSVWIEFQLFRISQNYSDWSRKERTKSYLKRKGKRTKNKENTGDGVWKIVGVRGKKELANITV